MAMEKGRYVLACCFGTNGALVNGNEELMHIAWILRFGKHALGS